MKESHHDNIVNFLDAYLVDGEIWVAMEFVDGGALTDLIFANEDCITEGHIAFVCWQVFIFYFYLFIYFFFFESAITHNAHSLFCSKTHFFPFFLL